LKYCPVREGNLGWKWGGNTECWLLDPESKKGEFAGSNPNHGDLHHFVQATQSYQIRCSFKEQEFIEVTFRVVLTGGEGGCAHTLEAIAVDLVLEAGGARAD
jgi:hypothetical protein